jgi:hypothetical protein
MCYIEADYDVEKYLDTLLKNITDLTNDKKAQSETITTLGSEILLLRRV